MSSDKNPDNVIFEAVDPDFRQSIYTQGVKQHVFKNHPEIAKLGNTGIKETVENPDHIAVDKDFEKTYNYYRTHGKSELTVYGTMVKVPVDYGQGEQFGSVKTVYLVDNLNKDDKVIWSK